MQRPNLAGQQFGIYKLLRLIGVGGFAEVYLGEHLHLGTQVAIKVLHTQLTNSDVDAFRNEARIIARLLHPHIIRVLDFNVVANRPFLVMDYAVGGTTRARFPKGTIVPLATIVAYIQQIADALQYAHDAKLIHRDIKPENILLDQHYNVLLSDFGIASATQSSRNQSTQDVIGTAAYMSPEQIQGKPRPASDQYSLGVVVYEWLCGSRPFEGSLTELWSQHMFAAPPQLRKRVPTISPEIEYVVMTALQKDPKKRFNNIHTFSAALQEASQIALRQTFALPSLPLNDPVSASKLQQASPIAPSHPQPRQASPIAPPYPQPHHATPYPQSHHVTSTSKPEQASPLAPPYLQPHNTAPASKPQRVRPVSSSYPLTHSVAPSRPFPVSNAKSTPSGSLKWSFHAESGITSSPAVVNGMVYFGSYDSKLYALDASSGQQKWAFPTGNLVTSSPTVAHGIVYFGSRDRNLYALEASFGQKLWSFSSGNLVNSSPTVVKGIVYFGSRDGNLYAISISFRQKMWTFPTRYAVDSSPTVANNILCFGSDDRNLYALDASSGQQKWSFLTGGKVASSPTIVNGAVYFGSHDGSLYALNVSSGQRKWSVPTGKAVTSSPMVANDLVYFGSDDHNLYALDTATGQKRWVFSTGDMVRSSPTVVNGTVYFGSDDGNLYALDASSGQQKWAFPTAGKVQSAPAIANGIVYFGSQDGNFYAIFA